MIKAIFKTSGSGYKEIDAHNGETVWILRQLIDGEEVDVCEVGRRLIRIGVISTTRQIPLP